MTLVDINTWSEFIDSNPNAHILQTPEWGLFKQSQNWYPRYLLHDRSGAQVLFRRLALGFTLGYIPKGPIGKDWEKILSESVSVCKDEKAIVLYVEPDNLENETVTDSKLVEDFIKSPISIQPRRTIILSLEGGEENWLNKMKQKTRYNIRLAIKKNIKIEQSDDVKIFNDLIKVTGSRDRFGIHSEDYYKDVYQIFSGTDNCRLLIAKYENIPIAAIMVFARGKRAWYFYGASNNLERNRMPTYLLQWEGIKWAASRGCIEYDLWGIPDEDEDILERDFMSKNDGLWGVYRFKRGFGGEIKRTTGVFQKVLNYPLFLAYSMIVKMRQLQVT